MLTSSPPCGPCSCVHNKPVCGCSAAPLHVAIAEGELLGLPSGLAREGIVGRHATVVMQPDHRSGEVVGLLRARHLTAIAQRDVKKSSAVEHQPRAEMQAGIGLGQLAEDHFDVLEAVAREAATRHFGADPVRTARGVRKIDKTVFGELRMQRDVHQTALPVRRHLRKA